MPFVPLIVPILIIILIATYEIRSPIPNIGKIKDIERILYNAADFEDSTAAKLSHISNYYGATHIRYVKADGNCFYRAFMFAYMEKVIMKGAEGLYSFCKMYFCK